ncbi:hypothetical protein SAMD00079811_64540 [Scytonema sp. HK-05]|uniref:hypothetical protein n=1 Tax=Scytonema sp. HK-05 TaxID=1137095 RepID=UPI000937C29D|nr:hypothetical protein [Scytonema sp. HK-05]OKH59011.1 hypothetical protein NIES2130_10625 [Scytonema sp. HK-05]BAY48827.1 hypothetical protein SAMD00079811_64540 [Scytonema sp. HK-05]
MRVGKKIGDWLSGCPLGDGAERPPLRGDRSFGEKLFGLLNVGHANPLGLFGTTGWYAYSNFSLFAM